MRKRYMVIASVSTLLGVASFYLLPNASLPTEAPQPPAGKTRSATNSSPDTRPTVASTPVLTAQSDSDNGTSREPTRPQPATTATQAKPATTRPDRNKIAVLGNKAYPVRVYTPLLTPNDPLYSQPSQWWTKSAKLDRTWDTPAGGQATVLAVIDTGFALKHEEFQNRWYNNANETGVADTESPSILNCSDRGLEVTASCNLIDEDGDTVIDNEFGPAAYENASRLNCTDQEKPLTRDCNQVDDDANGYIDDVSGWDFINHDSSAQAGELNPYGEGTEHGTQVAGIAAATGNNAKGLAGVDWQTKIMPLQALDDDAYGDTLSVARAIMYATAQGADVISLSLGTDFADEYVRYAVQNAIAQGIVVVAASGNDGCTCMTYPAAYPEVLAVGALAPNNQPASYSSWGDNLDILAPGTSLGSTTWSADNQTGAYSDNISGTSFATPLVSGMLTRLRSQQPQATPLHLIAAITENTDRLRISASTPHSPRWGFGAIDGLKVTQRMTTPSPNTQPYGFDPVSPGTYPEFNVSETAGSYIFQPCYSGTTPLFRLTKGNTAFISGSPTEAWKAEESGYTSNLFGYACMRQPHDTGSTVQAVDVTQFGSMLKKP